MTDMDRRHLLRVVAPAVALPMVATMPAGAKEMRLVTQDEIMEAFRFYDGMQLVADDLNLRYQILIDMLFETNPESLRTKLQLLRDNRAKRDVIINANTGQTAPYDPSMYDDKGEYKYNRWQAPEFNKPLEGIAYDSWSLSRWAKRQLRKWVIGI